MSRLYTEILNVKQKQAEQLKNFDIEVKTSTVAASPSTNMPAKYLADSPTSTSAINQPNISNDRTVEPNGLSERSNHSPTPQQSKTSTIQVDPGSKEKSVMAELATGPTPETKRLTQRYSFEIYSDQVNQIHKLQYLYFEHFGKHLSKSRIIREALDELLIKALDSVSDSS